MAAFSGLQAVVQAWQPMQRVWSTSLTHRDGWQPSTPAEVAIGKDRIVPPDRTGRWRA